jgi:hypothetical protein
MSDAALMLEGAPVYGALGGCLGYVAGVEDGVLLVECIGVRGARLNVPLEWVEEVGESVRLCKTCNQVREDWLAALAVSGGR